MVRHVHQKQRTGLVFTGEKKMWTSPPRKDRQAKNPEKGFAPTLFSRIKTPIMCTSVLQLLSAGAQSPWYVTHDQCSVTMKHGWHWEQDAQGLPFSLPSSQCAESWSDLPVYCTGTEICFSTYNPTKPHQMSARYIKLNFSKNGFIPPPKSFYSDFWPPFSVNIIPIHQVIQAKSLNVISESFSLIPHIQSTAIFSSIYFLNHWLDLGILFSHLDLSTWSNMASGAPVSACKSQASSSRNGGEKNKVCPFFWKKKSVHILFSLHSIGQH